MARKKKQPRAAPGANHAKFAIVQRRHENGEQVAKVCDELGVAVGSYYNWRKRWLEKGSLQTPETPEPQVNGEVELLRSENDRLRRICTQLHAMLGIAIGTGR